MIDFHTEGHAGDYVPLTLDDLKELYAQEVAS